MIRAVTSWLKRIWAYSFFRYLLFFILFLLAVGAFSRKIDEKTAKIIEKTTVIREGKQFSQDFTTNKRNYVFESGVKVNEYISNFIARSVEGKKNFKVLYLKKRSIKNVTFFKSYLPVDVVEFDIGIQGPFMSLLFLAEKIKDSPFLIIWKNFSFTMKTYPVGESQIVFYTFIKRRG